MIRRAARLIVGALLALSGGVVALFIVAACDERFMTHEETSATYDAAARRGAIGNWIVFYLPRSAREIRIRSNAESNETWLS